MNGVGRSRFLAERPATFPHLRLDQPLNTESNMTSTYSADDWKEETALFGSAIDAAVSLLSNRGFKHQTAEIIAVATALYTGRRERLFDELERIAAAIETIGEHIDSALSGSDSDIRAVRTAAA